MQAMEVRDREIELRLEAFARARLSPDREAVARTRARLMREARLQFEAAQIAGMTAPSVLAAHRSIARRLAMPILAAGVWVALAVGSISASTAGGPLYHARMWIETAVLPADGASRANAEITRLNERLAEATAAAARGDAGAVQAAIEAYRQIADEALAGSAGDQTLQALVADALDRHLSVLAGVAATLDSKGNDTAAAAVEASIQRAIAHSQAVVDRVGANGSGGGNGSSGAPVTNPGGTGGNGTGSGSGAGTGSGSGAGSGSGDGAGSGAGTGTGGNPKPDKTPKPTPKPTPEPPDPQGQPDHTPRGPNP